MRPHLPRCSHPGFVGPACRRWITHFHTSASRLADNESHYQTLGIQPSATLAEVKKQFYALSKTHHPDRNPNDPEAAGRFVKLSEAYAVLGSPHKREKYDQELRHATHHAHPADRGSHFSSGPAGGRPASGLSRRRTRFHGPPPSFYRSGGWGAHGKKRQAHAETAGSNPASASSHGGFGPAGAQAGLNDDVPHFDREGHFRTQVEQEKRRRRRLSEEYMPVEGGGSVFMNFLFVGGIISFAILLPGILYHSNSRSTNNQEAQKTR